MRLIDIVTEGAIDMMSLAKKAKALLTQGMSEQQAQDALVKQGIPPRLAAQAVQMAQMSETVADQLTMEMPASLRNDPDGHTLIPHGGMGSGKEETWKNISIRKLQQVIDMIDAENYSGAEHVLYKNGFLQGAVQALARYEEFKAKQGKRPIARGKEVDLGEIGDPGGTTAGMVSIGAVYKNKPGKTPKNKDGTAKNALDMKANLLTGGSIAKR
jgi:hypothetical protein